MLKYIIALGVFAIAASLVYIRLGPVDTAQFHKVPSPQPVGDYERIDGIMVVREITDTPINVMGELNRIALDTPRTRRIAGDLGTDLVTYETRSLLIGFPDYATVSFVEPDTIGNERRLMVIDSRLRFGNSDLGVNKRKVMGWLEALGPLTVTP